MDLGGSGIPATIGVSLAFIGVWDSTIEQVMHSIPTDKINFLIPGVLHFGGNKYLMQN
jgi:hypothetical protein